MAQEPTGHADLMNRIDTAWAQLQAGLASLTEAQLNTPDAGGWSIKDNLAHLTAWERALLHIHLQNQPAAQVWGLDAATLKSQDAINAAIQQRSSSRSAADILAESHIAHAQLRSALQDLSFDRILQPRYSDQPERGPLLGWIIGDTYDHYEEHGAYIQKQLRQIQEQ